MRYAISTNNIEKSKISECTRNNELMDHLQARPNSCSPNQRL